MSSSFLGSSFTVCTGEISRFESKYCANTRGAPHSANAPTKKMEIIFFITQLLIC